MVYFIAALMLITPVLYFGVAIFGDKTESGEAHFSKALFMRKLP